MGQDSAGFRGGEVEFQVSEFFEPMGMSRRILPWAHEFTENEEFSLIFYAKPLDAP
eukprot:COSAG02_NODE_6_length_64796_cov_76.792865_9_plen_56_part_00